jgi:Adenylate cyclase, family 3 (some proteins contain HAMP domain)
MPQLPAGTVTFVFTDIEGSTQLLQDLGDADYGRVSSDHRRLVREAFAGHDGTEIDTQGDAFFFSFARARDAVAAAVNAQRALRDHEWPGARHVKVRMGLHTGEPHMGEEGYLGLDVVRAARISAAGHGGQVLLSETTRALLGNQLPDGVAVHDLGDQHLKDIAHEHVYELAIDGDVSSKPLRVEARKSRGDEMAARFEDRIESYVQGHLERAFSGETARPPARLALGGAAIGLGVLFMVAVVFVAIGLLIKVAFF